MLSHFLENSNKFEIITPKINLADHNLHNKNQTYKKCVYTDLQPYEGSSFAKSQDNNKKHSEERFDPYEFNTGTSLAINHENVLILASDTRHSSEMGINSRNTSKIHRFAGMFLITTGFYADGYEIVQRMKLYILDYEIRNNRKMTVSSAAHLLHNILYSRRFFPFYSYCLLCGFEKDEAKLFSYDPVGSYAETNCRVDGSGTQMIQPILDSKISNKNREDGGEVLSLQEVEDLVKIGFVSVAERDVKTGDFLEILVVSKDSVRETTLPLRFD